METEETLYPKSTSLVDKEELKNFYKSSLPKILKTIFLEPINGTYALFSNRSEQAYFNSLVLMASTVILYIILPYILMGEQLREVVGFSGAFKTGIGVLIFMLSITVVSFGLKAVSGKPQFKNELLTGGLCGIPLIILLILAFVVKIFAGEDSVSSIMFDPTALLAKAGIVMLLMFYVLLMMINILQQSLRAAGTKDAWNWYMSPAGIFLASYISYKITAGLF
ncbi:MAG TPA: hypothetical protein VK668_21710 [Mucilaginibacter sp.]|nr:hypothetical protein [Mucilaginibacter sp.]